MQQRPRTLCVLLSGRIVTAKHLHQRPDATRFRDSNAVALFACKSEESARRFLLGGVAKAAAEEFDERNDGAGLQRGRGGEEAM